MNPLEPILEEILKNVKRGFNLQAYTDLHHMCLSVLEEDQTLAMKYLRMLSAEIEQRMPTLTDVTDMQMLYALHKKVLLAMAPFDFEAYLLYVESNRDPKKKFYPPRRKALHRIVEALQRIADDELDLLAISVPPGCGKTTLAIFYMTWLAGRNPNEPMLTGSHSNSFIRGVYDEVLRIFDDNGDYLWHDVFPNVKVSNTNAKDCRIDLGKRKRFETLQFTSIGTGNAGLYRAAQLLYCDDLVSGLEVALSPDRLDKLWETYNTDLRQRKIGDHCAEIHIATRWANSDVIGRLEDIYGGSSRAEFISMPALDENDESNFDYDYGVGFSTKFYHEQREIMDDVNWQALYMNQPIDRTGQLYAPDEVRRFMALPDGEPEAIISVCDTKDKGSDYCAMPIGLKYGKDYYITKIICDNGKPEIVEERLVQTLLEHKVQMSRFESNSAGGHIARDVQKELKSRGGITDITTKYTTANKETKIVTRSGWIKEHCLFWDESCYPDKEYREAMRWLFRYSMNGKNKHDDIPDGMAQFADFAQSLSGGSVRAFSRPF